MKFVHCFCAALALTACAPSQQQKPAAQATTTQSNEALYGRFSPLLAEFKSICLSNIGNNEATNKTAKLRGYRPFFLKGYFEKKEDGYNVLALHNKNKGIDTCQIFDSTLADSNIKTVFETFLRDNVAAFDPKRTRTIKGDTQFLVDVGNATYAFYSGTKSDEGRAKNGATAVGFQLVN